MKSPIVMNNKKSLALKLKPKLAVAAAFAVALTCVFSPPAQNASAQSTQTPWQNQTQSQLSAVWWQWILGVPTSVSPWFDSTGAKAGNSQPYFSAPGGNGSVLFLIGTITIQQLQNGDVLGQVTRTISVKQGTAFFFPLINTEWDNICAKPHLGGNCFGLDHYPAVLGVPDLQALAASSIDAVTTFHSTVTPTDNKFRRTTGPAAICRASRSRRSICRAPTAAPSVWALLRRGGRPSMRTRAPGSRPRTRRRAGTRFQAPGAVRLKTVPSVITTRTSNAWERPSTVSVLSQPSISGRCLSGSTCPTRS